MSRSLKAVISWVMDAPHFSRCEEVVRASPGVEPAAGVARLFIYISSKCELQTLRPERLL